MLAMLRLPIQSDELIGDGRRREHAQVREEERDVFRRRVVHARTGNTVNRQHEGDYGTARRAGTSYVSTLLWLPTK